jgi:hypothetical protein
VITRKGGKVVTLPLAPRTARAIDLAVGERVEGPIFFGSDGQRLDRHGTARIVRRVARRAGITKPVSPHALRHAFITAALDAGVPAAKAAGSPGAVTDRDANCDHEPTIGAVGRGWLGACFPRCRDGCSADAVGRGHPGGIRPSSRRTPERDQTGLAPQPPGRQPCLCPASTLSPSSRRMAAPGAEPQLRVWRKSSGRTRRRSSTSCSGSHGRSSTRAQNRVW